MWAFAPAKGRSNSHSECFRCASLPADSQLPKKFPGLSNSTPSNHEAFSRSGTASTTRPVLLAEFETSSIDTGVSSFSRSRTIKPQPCALTTTVLHSSLKAHAGSRLVSTTGIYSDRRELRLVALLRSNMIKSPATFRAEPFVSKWIPSDFFVFHRTAGNHFSVGRTMSGTWPSVG